MLFKGKDDWKDVQPVPQNDGPNPVVPIAYSPVFQDAMDYFRAICASGEKSQRALQLTARVITLNAANYTVWHVRRVILEALDAEWSDELDFIESMAESNPKNYQIWYHRMWVASRIGPSGAPQELSFTTEVLSEDAKNYHAWSHRQWALRELGGWEGELDFCSALLEEDVRNNSAWNQRYFVITESPLLGGLPAQRQSEVDFTLAAIRRVPSNESAWRYLRGLYRDSWHDLIAGGGPAVDVCREVLGGKPSCAQALSFLLDLLTRGVPVVPSDCQLLGLPPDSSTLEVCQAICEVLETAVDTIRSQYWTYRRQQLDEVKGLGDG